MQNDMDVQKEEAMRLEDETMALAHNIHHKLPENDGLDLPNSDNHAPKSRKKGGLITMPFIIGNYIFSRFIYFFFEIG